MAKLKNYNGRYCESEYESAFIAFLQSVGWTYLPGNKIKRCYRDVLIADDFRAFITKANTDLLEEEIEQIYDTVRLVGAESDFATLHKVYKWMVDGIQFTPQSGLPIQVTLIDFETPENNIFHVVNQLTVDYINNGQRENRRPDVLLYVNGMPLCIIELKNPADSHSTIYDAWEQITIRYWRDIPHLLHYCPLACISDGVKTRLGTVRTPYEHFYAWRRVNDADKISTMPFAETETMIKGVYAPERFLEIFRDYIYFQDEIFDCDEREIVCRYPQFFAVRLLKQSIIKSVMEQTGKGGTYFGATGCGKTYTMAFLARQLALRCSDIPEIGSPTIVMIVDRDELQEQGIKLFAKSKEFLNLGEVSIVKSRNNLRQELGSRESGGFYICTIQKFCDRKEDKIGLINDRHNIICFSDEAHRTQLEHSRKIQFSKDADENMKAMAIAGFVRKMSGTTELDTDSMNRAVSKMVDEALRYNQVESVLDAGEEEDIFSPEYFEKLSDVKMPATKLELLIKMIRKQIKEYSKINKIVAKTYQEMLEETIAIYHERRKHISAEEAGATQEQASEDIIKNATEQALQILRQMNESRESFRKIGLTFEEKAFYDILVSLRDQYNFEYGEDKEIGGMIVNDKCKILAKKVKEIIDTKSSFSDWLNNQNVRNQLKLDIKICLVKNGYPPQYSPEVFTKVMEQVENFEENSDMPMATTYTFPQSRTVSMVAEDIIPYGNKSEN